MAHGVPELHPEEKGKLNVSPRSNYIEQRGGLPPYINAIAVALVRKGMTRSHAIATARNSVKKTCATGHWGGNPKAPVSAAIKAAACSAAAQMAAIDAGTGLSAQETHLELARRWRRLGTLDLAFASLADHPDAARIDLAYRKIMGRIELAGKFDPTKHPRAGKGPAGGEFIGKADSRTGKKQSRADRKTRLFHLLGREGHRHQTLHERLGAFQRKHGLKVTGNLNGQTRRHIRRRLGHQVKATDMATVTPRKRREAKHAMPGKDGGDRRFPIDNAADVRKAVKAVGRARPNTEEERRKVRRYIIRAARAVGASSAIPDNWRADGSLA